MRLLALLALGSLTACGAIGEAPPRTERAQSRLSQALAGKVAGAPQRCISRHRINDLEIVDRGTILYKNGRDLLYRNDPEGGCGGLDATRTLVVDARSGDLCRGDLVRAVDRYSGATVGVCAFSDFIPYVTPGSGVRPRGS